MIAVTRRGRALNDVLLDSIKAGRWADFPFRQGDIVISAPPRSGTTWTQMLCALLIFQTPDLPAPLPELSQLLEAAGESRDEVYDRLARQEHRRFIKAHLPLSEIPIDSRVTYIAVARHPLDTVISLYHHREEIHKARMREHPPAGGSSAGGPAREHPPAGGSSAGGPAREHPPAGGSSAGGPAREHPPAGGSSAGGPAREHPPAGGSSAGGPAREWLLQERYLRLGPRTSQQRRARPVLPNHGTDGPVRLAFLASPRERSVMRGSHSLSLLVNSWPSRARRAQARRPCCTSWAPWTGPPPGLYGSPVWM